MLLTLFYYLFCFCFEARWRILALPCKLWRKDAMNIIIKACIIMHNMIIEDEWDNHSLNHDYLFCNDDGTKFRVNHLYKDTTTETLASCNMREMRRKYKDNARHIELKNDLIEHLWKLHGDK